ncbi:hypothetical protein [uncultured Sphingomonas sp.]|uniref:hypothetical protein n=1 Tax=uncultured Sphingomonas sp. TaxID=158754 RepID=UPI0025D800EB|nr:hypothetical protein [uncultured Sphingomonas sp.]
MIALTILTVSAIFLYAREIVRNRQLVAIIDSERAAYNTAMNRIEAELELHRIVAEDERAR